MDYNAFILYCFNQGINPEIIRACRTEVMKDGYVFHDPNTPFYAAASLGYAELADIDSIERAIKQIKQTIWMSVFDFDALGRNLERLRTRQLIKNPHRSLTRRVLKAYYLLGGTAE